MLFVEKSLHRQFKLQNVYRGKIDGGTEWFELNWWQVPVAKTSLTVKAFGVNLGYVVIAILLVALLLVLVARIVLG